MSVIYGNKIDFYYGYINRNTVGRVTNKSYGGISDLLKMDIVNKCRKENRLLTHTDYKEIRFKSKYPTEVNKVKDVLEYEEYIASTFKNYVLIRIDINGNEYIDPTRKSYIDFIDELRNRMRFNLLSTLILGWIYRIEKNTEDRTHLHQYVFLDGDRYLSSNRNDSNRLYLRDIDYIRDIVKGYIDTLLRGCDLNLIDLNDTGNHALIVVNEDDLNTRNCVRVLMTYICKGSTVSGKSYGKAYIRRNEMSSGDLLYDWVSGLNRLLLINDIKTMSGLQDGIEYHKYRLKGMYELEEEIAAKYKHYLLMTFNLDFNAFNSDNIREFMKRYNTYRFNNKYLSRYEIAYFWIVNNIYENLDSKVARDAFHFGVYLDIDPTDQKADFYIKDITSVITRWFFNVNELINDSLYVPTLSSRDITDTKDYKDRNQVRYQLSLMGTLPNENEIIHDSRNIRLFSKSTVRDPR